MTDRERVVSVNDAAKIVGVSRRTIYSWMEEGRVRFVLTASGKRRVVYDSLFRDKDGQPIRSGTNPP